MTTGLRLLTAEDLWQMPEGGGHNELIEGELRPMTPAGYDHGIIAGRIAWRLRNFVVPNALGDVLAAETGFIVSRRPDTVLAPDAAFVARHRRGGAGGDSSFFEGPPDLAVEVVSKWDRIEDLREKARRFVRHGTPLVWVVDPATQTVEVFTPNEARVLDVAQRIDGGAVLPGFSCEVREFFQD